MAKSKLERLVRSNVARVILATGLLAAGLWAFVPYLTYRVASSAFVNAEIVRITAPIRGQLSTSLPAKGAFIDKETSILLIKTLVPDRRQLAVFEQQYAVAKAQVELARVQLNEIADTDQRLRARADAHRTAVLREIASQLNEAEADIMNCTVEREVQQRSLTRARQLASTGVVSNSRLEEAESAYASAIATCDAALARYDRLTAERDAADDGIYLRDSGNDTPYSQQQRDRLMLRRQDVETELLRESARSRQLEDEIALEHTRLDDASRYRFVMPADHVVWSVSASPGSTVVEGQSIVDLADCRHRFLSVELPERQVESIRHGDEVRIRLLGSDRWISGTVGHIRGSAAQTDDRLFAAQLPKPAERHITIDVVLPPDSMSSDPSRLCDIGRQAEVRFDRGMPDLFGLISKAFAGPAEHH